MIDEDKISEVLEAVVLGPDDKLVVFLPRQTEPKEFGRAVELARESGLSGRVVFFSGAEQVGVLRATKTEGATVGQCGEQLPSLLPVPEFSPIAWPICHLAAGHTGMHSDGEATWTPALTTVD